jgi:hypothetical protein
MRSLPILFSGPMVRAILAGTKTQTRRISTPWEFGASTWDQLPRDIHPSLARRHRFGRPGDTLWVRERWCLMDPESWGTEGSRPRGPRGEAAYYAATDGYVEGDDGRSPWRPSIHMPRWASRLTLEVADVRMQRLQDISEADACAEGAKYWPGIPDTHPYGLGARWSMEIPDSTGSCLGSARKAFANAWNKLHEGRHRGPDRDGELEAHRPVLWVDNPWVWAVSFEVKHGPA